MTDDLPAVDEPDPTCTETELLDWLCWYYAGMAERFYPPEETAAECADAILDADDMDRDESTVHLKERAMHYRALDDAIEFFRDLERRGFDPRGRAEREIARARANGLEDLPAINWTWYDATLGSESDDGDD